MEQSIISLHLKIILTIGNAARSPLVLLSAPQPLLASL